MAHALITSEKDLQVRLVLAASAFAAATVLIILYMYFMETDKSTTVVSTKAEKSVQSKTV